VPVIGILIIYEPLSQAITVKNVTISRQAHRWFIYFKIDTKVKITPKETEVVGVDLGVKSFGDMGFYEFRRQFEYRCKLYGSQLIIVDRWFPSSKTCSNCGYTKDSLSLRERVFNCESAHWAGFPTCSDWCSHSLGGARNL